MAEAFDVLLFELRGRRCALPTDVVLEVIAPAHVTPVPLAGSTIRGVIPMHGQPMALVDLGDLVSPGSADRTARGAAASGGWEEGEPNARATSEATLVVEAIVPPEPTPVRAALAVDRVMRVSAVEPPRAGVPAGMPFVSGIVHDADGPALLIDVGAAIGRVMQAVRTEAGGR